MQRKVYCRPSTLDLKDDEIAESVRPLYGLSDSGEYWHETLTKHHLNDLGMLQTVGDFALFSRSISGTLVSMSGTYVDDILQAGTSEEKARLRKEMADKFDIKSSMDHIFEFFGLEIDSSDPELRTMSQSNYIQRLKVLPRDSTFALFRSGRAKIAWTIHSRPDVSASTSFVAQETETSFGPDTIKFHNCIVKYLQSTADLKLKFFKLDIKSLRLLVYIDASFNNCKDGRSQLGHIIFLADATNKCSVLEYASHSSRRIAKSTSTAEAFAFVHGLDHAFLLKHDLETLLGHPIPILMLAESDILFKNITSARYTSERRLMIDINSAREAYNNRSMSNIALIKSEHNPPDGLTKVRSNSALQTILATHTITHPIEQSVIDSEAKTFSPACS